MSNSISYSIPKCSTGESFDFSRSGANDSTGNLVSYKIDTMACPAIRAPKIELLSRYIEATATLCGDAEFVETIPPHFYKRNDCDHYMYCVCYYGGPHNETQQYLMGRTWDLPGCTAVYYGVGFQDFHGVTEANWSSYQTAPIIKTPTTAVADFDGMTLTDLGGICGAQTEFYVIEGYKSSILSDEDTEDDAFARATSALSWSEWSESTYSTSIETRGSGDRTFFKRAVEIMTSTAESGTPNAGVVITLSLENRDYGSTGDWSDAGTQTISATTDENGDLDGVTAIVTSTYGKETRIKSQSVAIA